METCQCVGYGITSAVLLSLCLLCFGINVCLMRARVRSPLEAALL